MPPIDSILVPIDFSDHSQKALDTALDLAERFGAKVHLLHCYKVFEGRISPYGPAPSEDFGREAREAALKGLRVWRSAVEDRGIEIEEHVCDLFPSEAIAPMARELNVDLIVMGTRGLSGLKHVLLGSVTERTLRQAPCPVLTVKAG
jgi:nucleotide-binding universal stress UspA family protein